MKPKYLCILLTLLAVVAPTTATAGHDGWFLVMEGSLGSADQTLHTSIGAVDYEDIHVGRAAIGVGRQLLGSVDARADIGFVQRGAELKLLSVQNPRPTYHELNRDYLDISLSLRIRGEWRGITASLGGGPRLSTLLCEAADEPFHMDFEKHIVGFDPTLAIGCRALHLVAKYLWDWSYPWESSSTSGRSHVSDEVYFAGLGVEIDM